MKFDMTTTAQVERRYVVEAEDEEQAKKRLRSYLKDKEMVKEGVVVEKPEETTNTTTEQIKAAVEAPPEEPSAETAPETEPPAERPVRAVRS